MRPLAGDERTRARQIATRYWWDIALILTYNVILFVAFCVLIFWSVSTREERTLAWFLVAPAFLFPLVAISIWRAWRRWWSDLEADLSGGVVDQKSGRIYDRLRLRWLFFPRRYMFWAEGAGEAIELVLGEAESRRLKVGDSIEVDMLPRSQLVVGVREQSNVQVS